MRRRRLRPDHCPTPGRAIAGRSFSVARIWQGQNARQVNILGSDSDAVVRLTIAKIKLDAVIVEGTSRKSLKLGPGHMQDSALPGYSGNSVIVAHRDTFFRHLDELREGDEILRYAQDDRRGERVKREFVGCGLKLRRERGKRKKQVPRFARNDKRKLIFTTT